jgi:hypothetical protein
VLDHVDENVGAAFDPEVEPPVFGDAGLPQFWVAALGLFLGVERRVPEVANEKSELLVGGLLDGGRSLDVRALESARRDSAHAAGASDYGDAAVGEWPGGAGGQ